MMKRFIETKMWDDVWFQSLPNDYKLFWIFLFNNCDNAGVWTVNKKQVEFYLGKKVKLEKMIELSKNRIVQFGDGELKWYLNKFIIFQQGNVLNPNIGCHRQIIRLLEKYNIKDNILNNNNILIWGYDTPSVGLPNPISNSNSISNGISNGKEGGVGETKVKENCLDELFGRKFEVVYLKKEEYEKLVETYKKIPLDVMIEKMEDWCLAKGEHFESYSAAIRNWFRRDNQTTTPKPASKKEGSYYEQRD